MSAELPADSPDGAADDTPKVFDKEDDDGRYVNDDNLSDIKEDLVDEAREDQKQTGSDGGKSDSDDKEKKPLSLYSPDALTAANLFSNPLFGPSGLASMLSNPYAQAGLHPYSSLYAATTANQDVEKAGLFPGQFGGLPHPFSPWSYGAGAAALAGGLRYPFPGLRPQLPHMPNSPFSSSHAASAASRAAEEKKAEMERKKAAKNAKPHIKKPLNAFMLYMKEQRAKVVSECTLKESAAINQILGRKWHALSKEEQQKYYEMARKEREKHMVLYPGWSARDNYGKRKKENPTTGQMVEDYPNNESGSAKKCRAVYGLEAQHLWCAPCRRKKKCVRYPEGDQYGNPVQTDPSVVGGTANGGGLFGTGSPLHGLHGMLQNSPLSPQLGQASPNSFISHSPLASMMPDQSTLAAHQHLMTAFGQARSNQVSAASTNPAASHLATLQAHFQNINNQMGKGGVHSPLNERHTPQSDEHSAGSGSVGAGPGRLGQINGTIDVKLEEADDQLSPCVSPEPEEQPLKKIRMDPKCEILNRSSIAT